ncbi:hypothetical protein DCAR_0518886 [Daucus carota subsp. sativus]|uniref:Uncharacterized protein n=1 Tax=Daucus carota subsp. sativus TaxID=79200 RepID=A0A162A0M2_DAUCS|nr:PREDICTED: uncharacterized protein LOC108220034 [Daucus carota subsp. sativus]WOG99533.1 hypothetical protein DCAR_0518886 [Daucus carota subsp. sativus]
MVAISLYRGKLHKVPDVPRKWLTPTPTLSAKEFKTLLHRRAKALARLNSSTSNPNPNPDLQFLHHKQPQPHNHASVGDDIDQLLGVDPVGEGHGKKENGGREVELVGEDVIKPKLDDDQMKVIDLNPNSEMISKEERKREIEEKLKILNAKKHDLVQSLKQILNAEEQLKRRSSEQGMATQAQVSLQVDVTFDSGSMSRHPTPRIGSDGILRDGEGREAYDASNHNIHPRNYLRMSSVSPSSDSPHRRPFHSAAPHASRATLGPSASPSRFAPTGQQGNSASLPTVSASGTNYMASSPSPAASGGTSVFKDGRHVSPWK